MICSKELSSIQIEGETSQIWENILLLQIAIGFFTDKA
jgi:hypothetical protein